METIKKINWRIARSLSKFILGAIPIVLCASAYASTYDIPNEKIADAIYKAENSVKYPYGIKSIDTHSNPDYARKICLNSIKNAKKRYLASGSREDFIVFMGKRFSPPSINPNWVRLVTYFLNKEVK